MPNLLVAPRSTLATDATATARSGSPSPDLYYKNTSNTSNGGGYYADGAYVAVPDVDNLSRNGTVAENAAAAQGHIESSGGDLELDPQEAYYVSLLERFTALKNTLRSALPADAISPLSRSNPSSAELTHSIRRWRWILLHRRPTMRFFSQLPQESIVNGLAALESLLQRGELGQNNAQRSEQLQRLQRFQKLGAWAWGLLAKCRDVGEMGSVDVGVLRGLGKTAWWVLREIKAGVGEGVMEEEEQEEDRGHEGNEGDGGDEEGEIKDEDEDEDEVNSGIKEEEEEGEVQSAGDEEDSGDDDDDDEKNQDHELDVKNDHTLTSSPNKIPPSSITTTNTPPTTPFIQHEPQTTTISINSSPSESSPKLLVPSSLSTEPLTNGHQNHNHNPSSLHFHSRDQDQDLDPGRDRDSNLRNDVDRTFSETVDETDLAAAQQRLLNKLVSESRAEMEINELEEIKKSPNNPTKPEPEPEQSEPELEPRKQEQQEASIVPRIPPFPTLIPIPITTKFNHKPHSTPHEANKESKHEDKEQENENEQTKITMLTSISATMDMILTIVGERYGQRDLLVGRGFWGD